MPDYGKQKGGKPAKDQVRQRDRNVPLVPKAGGRADKSELLARMKAAAEKARKEG